LKKISKDKKYSLVDEKKSDGFTALHLACLNNYTDIVKILVVDYEHLNVNFKNANQQTALHLAVDKLSHDNVDMLVNYKQTNPNEYSQTLPKTCDVNALDKDNNTALHYLCRNYTMAKLKELKDTSDAANRSDFVTNKENFNVKFQSFFVK
jgi:ankyrin repeat protein